MRESSRITLETIIRFNAGLLLSLVTGASMAGQVVTYTSFEYDATTGALSATVQNPTELNLNLRTAYTYDKWGNRLTTTVSSTATGSFAIPSRTIETIKYDTGSISPVQYTNALGFSTSVKFDPGNLPLYVDELNGLRTQFAYDGYGRVSKQTRPDGNRSEWYYAECSSTTPCSISSAVLVATKYSLTPSAQENGPKVKTYYDVLNRVVRVETVGFNGTSTIIVDTEYDTFGRVYRTSRPYYAGQAIKWTVYSYDVLGRVVDVTGPDGSVVHTTYNGLATTVTNALSQKRTTTADGRGLTQQVADDAGGILTYSYDAAGRLVQTTDPMGNTIRIAYDLLGNKISMTDPDLGTINYEYDALGQLKKQTDAKNQVVTFQYDLLGRMTNRTEPDLVSSWTYDSCYKGVGRLCSTSADNGYKLTTTYDNYGRVGKTTTTIDADYNTSFTYNADGRLDTLTYPTGVQVKYVYTQLGYMSEVRNASTNALYWSANKMDAEGHLIEQSYGNGVITQQDFDPATGRITAIRAGTNNAVQNLAYAYDKHGNMLTRSDSNQGLWEGFLYDNLNRLTSNSINSTGAGVITQTYAYDSLGNITSRSDAGAYTYGTVNVRPHAVAQITRADGGIRQFAYDAAGNLIQEVERDAANNVIATKGRTETWTSFNMPLNLASASTSTQFVYGTDHQRIKEINPSSTTYFVHPDNSGGLLYEKEYKSATSIEHRHFITAGSAGVVAILKRPYFGAETLVYMHHDNLGSVTAVTDGSGNVIERMAYEPFGKRRTPAGAFDPNGVLVGASTNRGYTNHEELDSLGLVHMNGRIYDPATARFISADPTVPYPSFIESYNRYAYARNNPLFYVDATGYDEKSNNDTTKGFICDYFPALCPGGGDPGRTGAGNYIDPKLISIQAGGNGDVNNGTGTVVVTAINPCAAPMGCKVFPISYQASGAGPSEGGGGGGTFWGMKVTPGDKVVGQMIQISSVGAGGLAALIRLKVLWALAAKIDWSRIPNIDDIILEKPIPNILKNKAAGDAFRDEIAELLKKEGFDVETEVSKNTIFGQRRIDIEVSKNGQVLGGIETKFGNSSYGPAQRAKDAYLKLLEQYIVTVVRNQ